MGACTRAIETRGGRADARRNGRVHSCAWHMHIRGYKRSHTTTRKQCAPPRVGVTAIMLRTGLLLAFAATSAASAVELTSKNFDDVVKKSGKNAFVKFLAPWYDDCFPAPVNEAAQHARTQAIGKT